jgi:flagellar biosynthesis protein
MQAFAMGYEKDDLAPKVLARGYGVTAQRMVELARDAGIPVREDRDLAEVLSVLGEGECIPEVLYEAFAIMLAGIYAANDRLEKRDER